jgi:hypothetical protein
MAGGLFHFSVSKKVAIIFGERPFFIGESLFSIGEWVHRQLTIIHRSEYPFRIIDLV